MMVGDALFARPSEGGGNREFKGYVHAVNKETVGAHQEWEGDGGKGAGGWMVAVNGILSFVFCNGTHTQGGDSHASVLLPSGLHKRSTSSSA